MPNTGQILEALNDKTDRDLHNVDTGVGADAVVEYQLPDPNNGYKWYRKYASGWVEQGGTIANASSTSYVLPVTFTVTMANIYYCLTTSGQYADIGTNDSTNATRRVAALLAGTPRDRTTTGFNIGVGGSGGTNNTISWEVKGMAARS